MPSGEARHMPAANASAESCLEQRKPSGGPRAGGGHRQSGMDRWGVVAVERYLLRFRSATLVAASLTASLVRCVYRAVVWIWAWPRSLAITGRLSPKASARAGVSCGAGRGCARRRDRRGRAPDARARRCWRVWLPRLGAGDRPGVVGQTRQRRQHRRGLGRERDRARAGLAVAQSELLRLQAHVLPAQRQDLVAPAAGQHEQAERRRRVGRDAPLRLQPIEDLAEAAGTPHP